MINDEMPMTHDIDDVTVGRLAEYLTGGSTRAATTKLVLNALLLYIYEMSQDGESTKEQIEEAIYLAIGDRFKIFDRKTTEVSLTLDITCPTKGEEDLYTIIENDLEGWLASRLSGCGYDTRDFEIAVS